MQWLSIVKRYEGRVSNLSLEPMVFCFSDVWLGNFIIDQDGGITVIDFADASILPSSFSRFVLLDASDNIRRDISDLVSIPATEGVDNTEALAAVAGSMVMGWYFFAKAGIRLLGRRFDALEDRVWKPLLDTHGCPVTATRPEPKPRTPNEFDHLPPREGPAPTFSEYMAIAARSGGVGLVTE